MRSKTPNQLRLLMGMEAVPAKCLECQRFSHQVLTDPLCPYCGNTSITRFYFQMRLEGMKHEVLH